MNGSTVGAANDEPVICSAPVVAGPNVFYRIAVPAGARLKATVTAAPASGGQQQFLPTVFLVNANACASLATTTCFDRTSPFLGSLQSSVSWFNFTTNPTDVLIVVGATQTSGAFTLTTRLDVPAAGDWCDQPTLLSDTAPLSGLSLSGFVSDYENRLTSCLGDSGGDRYVRVDVPAARRATFTLTSTTSQPLSVSAFNTLSDCRARDCNASALFSTGSGTFQWTNRSTLRATTMYLAIDGPPTSTSPFSLSVAYSTIPGGELCTNSLTLPTTPTTYSLTGFVADYPPAESCSIPGNRPDLVFGTLLNPTERLEVRVSSDGGTPSADIIAGATCDGSTRACSGSTPFTFNTERIARFFNPSGTRSVNVVTSALFSDSLRVSSSVLQVAPDELCSTNVTTIGAGRLLNQPLLGFTDDYNGPDCTTGNHGADRVYKVVVPSGQRLTALASAGVGAGVSPSLALVEGPATNCDAPMRRCINKPSAVQQLLNPTAAPKDVFVIVGSDTPVVSPGQFTLDVGLLTPPRGDLCTDPLPIASGASLTQGFAPFFSDYTTCSAGADMVYRIDVPAGQSLAVTANFAPGTGSVSFVPAGADCFVPTSPLLCRTSSSTTTPVLATWANTSGATVPMLIVLQTTRNSAGVSVVVQ